MAKKVLQLTQASKVWGPVKYCRIIFRGYFLFYSLAKHAKLSKKQIRVGKSKKKKILTKNVCGATVTILVKKSSIFQKIVRKN